MQVPSHQIPIANPDQLPNFPTILDFTENEAFTSESWHELFERAVARVPKYPIAIVQLPVKSAQDTRRYKIYDGLAFRNYLITCQKKNQEPLDLTTREKIPKENVFYFAINCFDNYRSSRSMIGQTFTPLFPAEKSLSQRLQRALNDFRSIRRSDRSETRYYDTLKSIVDNIYPQNASHAGVIKEQLSLIHKFTLDGLNFHSDEHHAVGQSQRIIARAWNTLLDPAEADIWMRCSNQNLKRPVKSLKI